MNKALTVVTVLLFLVSINSEAQWNSALNMNDPIYRFGNIGIGSSTATHKLDIINNAGEAPNLFRVRVDGALNDYFTIVNATGSPNQFIPSLYGYHSSDNRQALYITGAVNAANDVGSEPIMVFDSRLNNAPSSSRPLFAWDSYGSRRMTLLAGGNLGIGISTPTEKLSVNGGIYMASANSTDNNSPGLVAVSDDDFLYDGEYINNYGFGFHNYNDGNGYNGTNSYVAGYYGFDVFTGGIPRLRINNSGSVGIGTQPVESKLHIADGNGGEQLRLSRGTGVVRFAQDNNQDNLYLFNSNASLTYMFWKSNGYVGIGTNNPTQKLTVNGTVYSTEVKVDVNAGTGPDYVFEPTYNLPTLAETEAYIKANKHLPEVPSAKEMEANGINLSEMNMVLLKKVEELTLYQIEAARKIELLENQVQKLIKKEDK